MLLDCDAAKYGGYDRLQPPDQKHFTITDVWVRRIGICLASICPLVLRLSYILPHKVC